MVAWRLRHRPFIKLQTPRLEKRGVSRLRALGFANDIGLHAVRLIGLYKVMPGFDAKMWHINDCRRIIRLHFDQISNLKRFQPLAQLQNGQGAQKPGGIQGIFWCHTCQIAALLQPVHKVVTQSRVTRGHERAMSHDMFGIEIIDAGLLPAMIVALMAGIISFLSPCVLPIVPPYLAYMSGVSLNELSDGAGKRARAVVPALFFVLGLSTVFLFLGFTASAIGTVFLQYQSYFNTVAGVLVMAFGAHFIGIYRISFLDREARIDAGDRGGSSFGAYVLGLAFAFGWTPCIGPQLGAILSLAASEGNVARGTTLLAVYAFGLGVPFILVAAFLPRLTGLMGWMKRHMEQIERVMGLLLWTIGLLMLTGGFSAFSFWLLEHFPALAVLG